MEPEILEAPPIERESLLEKEIAERRRIPRDPDLDDDISLGSPASSAGATTERTNGHAPAKPAEDSPDDAMAALRAAAVTMGPSVAFDLVLGASAAGLAVDAMARPSKTRAGTILRTAAAVGSLAAWGYLFGVRPWQLRWGASEREVRSSLPGDGVIPRPTSETTRAITIETPASYIWPWIAQLGAGRGGFYSYDWLENLAGLDIHTVDEILPQFQHPVVGDAIPFGKGVAVPIIRVEHERALVVGASIDMQTGLPFTPGGPEPERFVAMTWSFVLRPIDEHATRFITRFRLEQRPRGFRASYYPLMIELPHFVMERKMLLGIRDRAERMYRNEPT